MPGGRQRSYRLGDRTELVAECVLNTIAFTTRVPRQEDVGHDFLCALSELKNGFYVAGPSFSVQVKSNTEPLEFDKPHAIRWIKEQENPFFLAVGDRAKLTLDIYTTWNRLNGFLHTRADKIVFEFSPPPAGHESVFTEKDGSRQVIYLGKPIVTASIQDMMDEEHASRIRRILQQWVKLDRENIVNNSAEMHWTVGPTEWETNKLLLEDHPGVVAMFWNAKNLDKCHTNFVRTATELRLTLRNKLGAAKEQDPRIAPRIAALESVLLEFQDCIDMACRTALMQHVEMQFEDDQPPRSDI